MTAVTWNEFRSLHKGTTQQEIKTLWAQYKEGEYEIESENTETKADVEEIKVEEEVAEEPVDHRKEFLSLFNQLYILDPESGTKSLHGQLLIHAKATRPDNYMCGKGDGWTIYLGPTQKAILVNESHQTAFSITRAYWQKFYIGAALVDEQIFENETGIERLKKQFHRMGKLVRRYPVPGLEIMVPASKLDIPLPSGVL